MWPDLARLAMSLVFAFTAGVCLVRARLRASTVRIMLAGYAITSAAMFAGQLSLFGTPLTIRSLFSAVAATADVWFMASLFRHGPPAHPEP